MRLFEIECGAQYSDGHDNVREVLAVSATGDTVTYEDFIGLTTRVTKGPLTTTVAAGAGTPDGEYLAQPA
jgi:NAD(P)H-dependent flavin oxidoreductase YrpB (nitropropane dioxygenase family)